MTLSEIVKKRNDLSRRVAAIGAVTLLSGNNKYMDRHNELIKEYRELDRKIAEGDYE